MLLPLLLQLQMLGAQSGATPEAAFQVVLLPGHARYLSKEDRALYMLTILANDSTPRDAYGERLPTFNVRPPRMRKTGLEYAFE